MADNKKSTMPIGGGEIDTQHLKSLKIQWLH